jgi:hypothetical protein
MSASPELRSDELRGQQYTRSCALIELDNDSLFGRPKHIRKICEIAQCAFSGYIDSDGITVQDEDDRSICYKANNGLRDDFNSDDDFVYDS